MGAEQEQSSMQARKRRIELRAKQRLSQEKNNEEEDLSKCFDIRKGNKRIRISSSESSDRYVVGEMKIASSPASCTVLAEQQINEQLKSKSKPKPTARRVNKYNRYEPGVPMTKEELKNWRKEARRVRNRESAAASRLKTRGRIEELELEVDGLRTKYQAALDRIDELELLIKNNKSERCNPNIVSPHMQAVSSPAEHIIQQTPLLSLSSDPFILDETTDAEEEEDSERQEKVASKVQHIIKLIPRPNA